MSSRASPIRLAASLLLAASPTRLLSQTPPRPWQPTDYYKLVSVGNPRLAPDGRRVAFPVTTVVEDKDRRHTEIWLTPVDGSTPPRTARSSSPGATGSPRRRSPAGPTRSASTGGSTPPCHFSPTSAA